ncbi:TIGR03749 family integrating conjugative element protein [Salmonella enterica]|uniref:TIGR03749 family integrating conjugative element protein n=2 Tax=Salmonella enterica TaxID=28901 RepID=A0A763VNC7_SALER|nr:TIGR03749 family integrating conjugative element protein [Salmonella enterica]CAX68138.1 putative exported protein [Salmonella enterica subsp. enterica] [Salmonella enterica subsp. enterica serovar Senftenberg]HAB1649549.1 TIGR03749 family integrating conjugative element protein [Salmonella enterica subsp. enterica]EBY8685116.1 TIGR03749 family integrating conjugative element protein [Salmonella enterica subsp. enterica serovar Agona]EHW1978129.1 TIGR03749 family integrating conjugative elem
MKKFGVFLTALLLLPSVTDAVELMKWERIPLQIPLTVGQERIVFVDKNVRVGFPDSLNNKLRVQSSGGAVYLDAREAFPVTRLQLQDKENGEILLLDVSATEGKTSREPVKVVYDGEVASATSSAEQKVSGSTGNSQPAEEKKASHKPAKLNAPLPVVLTRYAAQSLYGPLRTVEAVPGIIPVSLKLPSRITTLLSSEQVVATPLAAWSLQGSSVVAVQVRNRSADKIILDPRALRGDFLAATFQHRWLGRAGTPEDTTVLYLVMQGRPEGAFIAEPALSVSGKTAGKRAAK